MVKRYDIEVAEITSKYHAELVPVEHPQGDYVLHSDYATLAERCERLEAALRMARSELYGLPHSLGYEFTHLPQIDAVLGEELK